MGRPAKLARRGYDQKSVRRLVASSKSSRDTSVLNAIRRNRLHSSAGTKLADDFIGDIDIGRTEGCDEADISAQQSASVIAANRAFGKSLRDAITLADVVIEVLDARDPQNFRSEVLEEFILRQGKKLVLLLNKIDLVPDPEVVRKWCSELQRQHPVIAFRSMTTASRSKKSTVAFNKKPATEASFKELKSGYAPLGAADLMSLLANYTRVEAAGDTDHANGADVVARAITVSIVGMPNTGKSSIINSLLRNTRCLKTGDQPGITRVKQTVRLSNNIKLVDTPGVVIDQSMSPIDQILHGTLREFESHYCDEAITKLLTDPQRREAVYRHFDIDASEEMEDADNIADCVLARVCDKRGLLLCGGRRDFATAKKLVITDWAAGAIPYCVRPEPRRATNYQIITTASPELDLDNL